jgi:O-antigen ligase
MLGLAAMLVTLVLMGQKIRRGFGTTAIVALLLAAPFLPSSFWSRMASINDEQKDKTEFTGSRETRINLTEDGIQTFLERPFTGVGAGQFQNYNAPGETIEKWRVTHNVWLQVACDLGIFGLFAFGFLVARAYRACFATLAALRPPRRKRGTPGLARSPGAARPRAPAPIAGLSDQDRHTLDLNAKSMLAAMVGWTICSFFASVAFNWTFYYVFALAVAGREIAMAHRGAAVPARDETAMTGGLVRAHA